MLDQSDCSIQSLGENAEKYLVARLKGRADEILHGREKRLRNKVRIFLLESIDDFSLLFQKKTLVVVIGKVTCAGGTVLWSRQKGVTVAGEVAADIPAGTPLGKAMVGGKLNFRLNLLVRVSFL